MFCMVNIVVHDLTAKRLLVPLHTALFICLSNSIIFQEFEVDITYKRGI